MDSHERRIVSFLRRPSAYPHPAGAIERRETHVSHVFLAGGFAYKLKKPVTFPFLDASTLASRLRFCKLELSLNRRLAPSIYLGIVPVTEQEGRLQLGGKGRVIEWLVKMKRLPERRMLDQLVVRHRVSRRDMVHLADRLMPFFRRAERSRAIDQYGTPEAVGKLVLGNLEECAPFVGRILPEADRRFLEAAYRQFLALHEPLLARRLRERRVIDGHGDLRCENICMTAPVNVFDCVEFQPAFRCGDLVNDFSFLLMDLEFRGRGALAATLVEQYRRRMGDRTFEPLLAFYKCHRSLVRGKVRGFAWLQHPKTAEGRRIRNLARHHFQLAVRYARQFAPPRLIVVGGLIGTGKSTLARSLARGLGASWLRTDEIRLREFAHKRRANEGFGGGIYARHVSELVYRRLIQRAETLVRQGRSVVCDGTFSKAEGRQALRAAARRHGASFHFFECVVPRAVALRRVARRYAKRSDLSEARPEHYDRLKAGFEPVRDWSGREWTRLSDNRPAAQTYQAALDALRRS
jgi:aminoglycoside phosphotransferase family enzyme/predicted kinase